jgi:peroxiredoxin
MSGHRFGVLPAFALAIIVTAALTIPSLAAVTIGSKAPNFELGNVDGKGTIKLSDYTNKPTLLVFWASWCPHCRTEASVLQKIYTDLHDKGANVLGVNLDNTLAEAQEFVNSHHLTYPNAFAGTSAGIQVVESYGVQGIPALFLIDKDGVVKDTWVGEVSETTFKEAFASLGVK